MIDGGDELWVTLFSIAVALRLLCQIWGLLRFPEVVMRNVVTEGLDDV